MKKTISLLLSVFLTIGLVISCDHSNPIENLFQQEENPTLTYTVTFEPDKDLGEYVGEVHDANGGKVTTVTVPGGTQFSGSGNTITIGEKVFTVESKPGFMFSKFEPESGTITEATTIYVFFAQDQPPV